MRMRCATPLPPLRGTLPSDFSRTTSPAENWTPQRTQQRLRRGALMRLRQELIGVGGLVNCKR